MKLEIVTPEAKIFDAEIAGVVLPGAVGELGVLPGHEPLVTTLVPGELRVTQGGQEIIMAVGSGFAEITPHCVSVLTDMAVEADAIDEAAAEAARKRAEESLKQKLGSDEQALVEAALQKALTQLSVKRKHRGQKAG